MELHNLSFFHNIILFPLKSRLTFYAKSHSANSNQQQQQQQQQSFTRQQQSQQQQQQQSNGCPALPAENEQERETPLCPNQGPNHFYKGRGYIMTFINPASEGCTKFTAKAADNYCKANGK